MRRKVIISVALHTLAAVAGLLWLLWYFIPTGNVFNGLSTALIILLAGWYVFKNCRHEEPVSDANLPAAELPLLDAEGPVVLVCGDMLDALFQGSTLRKTAQGWWLRVGDVSRLTDVVRSIQTQFPHQVGQLSVMYRCLPDRHQDEAVLRSALKTLRQQCKQIKSLTGITLPAVLSAEFSGPETPWIIVRGDKPMVCPFNDSPQAFIDWQQTDDNILALPTVSQAFSFIRNTLADELEKPDGLTPPVRVFSVIMRLGVVNPETRSVWAGWLYSRTCLQFSRAPGQSSTSLFPDAVLPLLAPFASIVQGGQLSLKSGEGPVEVQAQNASLRLFAEKKLTLSSASDISFAGKKRITLIGGGSYLRLEAGKVEYGTTATYIRKVKRTMFAGANSTPTPSISMPLVDDLIRNGFFDEQFRILDDSGKPMANVPYFISSENGETFKGVTDNQGLCKRVFSKESAKLTVWLGVLALERW